MPLRSSSSKTAFSFSHPRSQNVQNVAARLQAAGYCKANQISEHDCPRPIPLCYSNRLIFNGMQRILSNGRLKSPKHIRSHILSHTTSRLFPPSTTSIQKHLVCFTLLPSVHFRLPPHTIKKASLFWTNTSSTRVNLQICCLLVCRASFCHQSGQRTDHQRCQTL